MKFLCSGYWNKFTIKHKLPDSFKTVTNEFFYIIIIFLHHKITIHKIYFFSLYILHILKILSFVHSPFSSSNFLKKKLCFEYQFCLNFVKKIYYVLILAYSFNYFIKRKKKENDIIIYLRIQQQDFVIMLKMYSNIYIYMNI